MTHTESIIADQEVRIKELEDYYVIFEGDKTEPRFITGVAFTDSFYDGKNFSKQNYIRFCSKDEALLFLLENKSRKSFGKYTIARVKLGFHSRENADDFLERKIREPKFEDYVITKFMEEYKEKYPVSP